MLKITNYPEILLRMDWQIKIHPAKVIWKSNSPVADNIKLGRLLFINYDSRFETEIETAVNSILNDHEFCVTLTNIAIENQQMYNSVNITGLLPFKTYTSNIVFYLAKNRILDSNFAIRLKYIFSDDLGFSEI